MTSPDAVQSRLRAERDFYRRLLDLSHQEAPDGLLREALTLIVSATHAAKVYIEIDREPGGGGVGESCWSLADGVDAVELGAIRDGVSRHIIQQALASGRTVSTTSALDDPRFRDHRSVQAHRIEAVLCAPIGRLGVVYLQGRRPNGPFHPEDRALVEAFALHLAPMAERLRLVDRVSPDPTAPWRRQVKAGALVGRSAAMADVLRQVALVAPLDVTVLITGPSGTGKTAVAEVIAANSARAGKPFVELNCAALPENLIESELFGAAAGAHSTATRRMPGKVEAAEGGTLFLDEIGELGLSTQAKLLQLLQSKAYYALGSNKAIQANIRVLAATSVDLQKAVAERRFREDLYYRLHVLPLRMPALSERRTDIRPLAEHVVGLVVQRHGLRPLHLSPGCVSAMEMADWPGNVRQLAHALEAAVIRASAEPGAAVESRHVFPDQRPVITASVGAVESFQSATRAFQRRLVSEVLETAEWNVTEAARRLDLTRSHLYNLIREFELQRPALTGGGAPRYPRGEEGAP